MRILGVISTNKLEEAQRDISEAFTNPVPVLNKSDDSLHGYICCYLEPLQETIDKIDAIGETREVPDKNPRPVVIEILDSLNLKFKQDET